MGGVGLGEKTEGNRQAWSVLWTVQQVKTIHPPPWPEWDQLPHQHHPAGQSSYLLTQATALMYIHCMPATRSGTVLDNAKSWWTKPGWIGLGWYEFLFIEWVEVSHEKLVNLWRWSLKYDIHAVSYTEARKENILPKTWQVLSIYYVQASSSGLYVHSLI